MPDNELQFAFDDGDPDWFVFRELDAASGQTLARHVLPSRGFDLHQLGEALRATPSIRQEDDRLLLQGGISVPALRDLVGEMFDYFRGPNVPTQQLKQVRAEVDAMQAVQTAAIRLPLFAYAWLDLIIRDDLAEAARSIDNVWTCEQLEVDVRALCLRRVEQLIRHYQLADSGTANRMAPSGRQRHRNDPSSKLG